jgi:ABC-type multidrug transport system fused ATPase/permease subunit
MQLWLNILQAIILSIDNIMATLMTLFNLIFFIKFSNYVLLPSYIVFSLGFYMRLCYSIGFNFTRSLTTLINGLVSIKRLDEFLLKKELNINNERFLYDSADSSIDVENLEFSWNEAKGSFKLKNITFKIKNGQFTAIIGPVGSGKVLY